MEWDDLRIFLCVARVGQVQLAAKTLGIDHSTVSRKLARLEERIGFPLFDRAARRLRITPNGMLLAEAAQDVESIILRSTQSLDGPGEEVSGRVRIGVPEGLGTVFLAPRLPMLCNGHPQLQIELCAAPRQYSLAAREVDILITMEKPISGNLRFKRLTDYALGVYGAPAYFSNRQRPKTVPDLVQHSWCGYIDEMLYTTALDLLRFGDVQIEPRFRTIDVSTQVEAILSGETLGVLPCFIAAARGGLERVLPDQVTLRRPYYVVVHEDLARTQRVRFVMAQIEQWVEAERASFLDSLADAPADTMIEPAE